MSATSAKYGSIEENGKFVDAVHNVEVDVSESYRRRRWGRFNQSVLFGLGHVYNDLCATMWFSYMMLFLTAMIEMPGTIAGAMLLLGQVVDALATPIVGILVDKYSSKKCWHLTGSILVSITFPLLFIRWWKEVGEDTDLYYFWMSFYYGTLIVFFQIGWAVVQISHLSMIPAISDSLQVRSELTSIRYMASVISSLMAFFITWIVFKATNYSNVLGPIDDYKFRDVSLIISGIGITSFVVFHMSFKLRPSKTLQENRQIVNNGNGSPLLPANDEQCGMTGRSKIMHFIRTPLLYQTSLLYVFSRLYWALTLVYVPLYLEERILVNPSGGLQILASVPLILYVSSFVCSLILKSKISSCGNKITYLIGSFLSLVGSVWIALAIDPEANVVQIYMVAVVIGAGSSLTLVSSLCVTADLIGPHTHQGAVVYSIVTFADKLITGIAVVTIENLKSYYPSIYSQYYRGVLTYACGGSALLGIICISFTKLLSGRNSLA